MGKLDDITLGDIIIGKKIPVVTGEVLLANALKAMANSQSKILLVVSGDEIKALTMSTISRHIVKNLWDLPVIINETEIGDVEGLTSPFIYSEKTAVKEAIEKMLTDSPVVIEKNGVFFEITPEEIFMLYIIWENEFDSEIAGNLASKNILKIPPSKSLISVFKKMMDKNVDAAIVINTANQPLGIVTLSDYVYSYKQILKKINMVKIDREEKINIREIMTNPVIFEFENSSALEALNKMMENNISHLPIVNNIEEPVGMIYKRNILSLMVEFDEGH